MLDDLDKELERRGHKFVRYADDCNIYVASKRAGLRVYPKHQEIKNQLFTEYGALLLQKLSNYGYCKQKFIIELKTKIWKE